jgi:hypothetical protein
VKPWVVCRNLIIGSTVLLGIVLVCYSVGQRDPSYGGRTLTRWTYDVPAPPYLPFESADASNAVYAIRQIGTNGLPFLLRQMQTRDSHFRSLCLWLKKKQSVLRLSTQEAQSVRIDACHALVALGPLADPALPELTRLLHFPEFATEVAPTLTFFGKEGYLALSTGLTNSQRDVRLATAFNLPKLEARNPTNATSEAVIKYRREAAAAIPQLLAAALSDEDPKVLYAVITALQCIGQNAEDVVPALEKFLLKTQQHTDSFKKPRSAAERAIQSLSTTP